MMREGDPAYAYYYRTKDTAIKAYERLRDAEAPFSIEDMRNVISWGYGAPEAAKTVSRVSWLLAQAFTAGATHIMINKDEVEAILNACVFDREGRSPGETPSMASWKERDWL